MRDDEISRLRDLGYDLCAVLAGGVAGLAAIWVVVDVSAIVMSSVL